MKTIAILVLSLFALIAPAQMYLVDYTTIQTNGHVGEQFPVFWQKVNSNTLYFSNQLVLANAKLVTLSNQCLVLSNNLVLANATNAYQSLEIKTNRDNITTYLTIANGMTNVSAQIASLQSGAAGQFFRSNTWDLFSVTNALAGFGPGKHYWTGNSNGQALVTLSYSNGVVRYIRED